MQLPATFRSLHAVAAAPAFRDAVAILDVPLTMPGTGEVLVRNRFMGINGSDPIAVRGGYGSATFPFELGLDSAGEVVAVGPGVRMLAPGDPVRVFGFGGGYAEYRLAKAANVFRAEALSPDLLAGFIPALTASVGLSETRALRTGETVLVTAAAGGVGSFAVQLAALAGNRVIGTTGDAGKAEWLGSLGCARVINYRRESLDAVLANEYPGGVDVVFDTVGREMFDVALRHLAPFGRLLAMGATAEYGAGVEWEQVCGVRVYQVLMAKSATLAGATLAMYPRRIWLKHLTRVDAMVRAGRLRAALDAADFVGLAAVPDAIDHLMAGRNRGKVVVRLP